MSETVSNDKAVANGTLLRQRWAGVLSAAQRAEAAAAGLNLAFDPAQGGWVMAEAPDALDDPAPSLRAALSRLSLRAWDMADLGRYHAMLSDPALWHYLPEDQPQPFTQDTARELMEISGSAPHHQVQAIIAAGVPVGQVRLLWQAPDLGPESAEISYWLGRDQTGRGHASEAVRIATSAAFAARPALQRVVAFIHPQNLASVKVVTRAGYRPDGTRPRDGWQVFSRARG